MIDMIHSFNLYKHFLKILSQFLGVAKILIMYEMSFLEISEQNGAVLCFWCLEFVPVMWLYLDMELTT